LISSCLIVHLLKKNSLVQKALSLRSFLFLLLDWISAHWLANDFSANCLCNHTSRDEQRNISFWASVASLSPVIFFAISCLRAYGNHLRSRRSDAENSSLNQCRRKKHSNTELNDQMRPEETPKARDTHAGL
jgi:hypothetical protein